MKIFICIFIVTSFALCMTSDAENERAKMWFSTRQNYPLEEATEQFSVSEDIEVVTQYKYKLFSFSDNAKVFLLMKSYFKS